MTQKFAQGSLDMHDSGEQGFFLALLHALNELRASLSWASIRRAGSNVEKLKAKRQCNRHCLEIQHGSLSGSSEQIFEDFLYCRELLLVPKRETRSLLSRSLCARVGRQMVNKSTNKTVVPGVVRKGWAVLGKHQRGSLCGGGI